MAETLPVLSPADPNGVYQIALAAHTVSITNATEMRLHREECKGRDERSARKFDDISETMRDMDEKLDRQTSTLADKIDDIVNENKQSNKTLYMIVGALILASAIFNKIPVHILGG